MSSTEKPGGTPKQTPSAFFQSILGRPVVVKLTSGVTYHGILACMDGYMNVVMEQTQEYFNGTLKNQYAETFLRGNNGTPYFTIDLHRFWELKCHKGP